MSNAEMRQLTLFFTLIGTAAWALKMIRDANS